MHRKNDPQGKGVSRRLFIKSAAGLAVGAAVPAQAGAARTLDRKVLQVWSCGGLAEAFRPANRLFEEATGIKVAYTGAFAAALGKSLLGSATTEVFAGRGLGLAKKLRAAGKMTYFKPLCFTRYVLATPKGNPAGVTHIRDLSRPGLRVIQAPDASPPGGKAVGALLKKAGVLEGATRNTVIRGSCVQRTMNELANGKGDVSVVEYRLTRMPLFRERVEIIPISEKYFPPPPLTFTIGVMSAALEPALADRYVDFIRSEEAQGCFASAGFIPAINADGRRLTEALEVKDDSRS